MTQDRIELLDGKYTVLIEDGAGRALRHGEEWAAGAALNNLEHALALEVLDLKEQLAALNKNRWPDDIRDQAISEVYDMLVERSTDGGIQGAAEEVVDHFLAHRLADEFARARAAEMPDILYVATRDRPNGPEYVASWMADMPEGVRYIRIGATPWAHITDQDLRQQAKLQTYKIAYGGESDWEFWARWLVAQAKDPNLTDKEKVSIIAYMPLRDEPTSPASKLLAALQGFDHDYMTSETHHPGYILIPTPVFERVRAALPVQVVDRG